MSTPNPSRRLSLAQSYRDLGEKQIRARLEEGGLSDVERVIAQAELLRRGAGEEFHDTAPGSRFAPTSSLDGVEAEQAALVASVASGGAGRRKAIAAVAAVVVVCAVGVVVAIGLLRH
jgi:hypothetical protein